MFQNFQPFVVVRIRGYQAAQSRTFKSHVCFVFFKLPHLLPPPLLITRSFAPGMILQLSAGRLEGDADTLGCPTTEEATRYLSGLQLCSRL